jgi:hypothetical protein
VGGDNPAAGACSTGNVPQDVGCGSGIGAVGGCHSTGTSPL